MNGNEKKKFILVLTGMIVLMVAFCFLLLHMAKKEPVKETQQEAARQTQKASQERQPTGGITLGKKKYSYYHDMETYLLIGTDDVGNTDGYKSSMADFLLLVVLDKTEGSYHFLPLNRDTMTDVPLIEPDGTGVAHADLQLCTAHWYGGTEEIGCENTVRAVSGLLGGMPIDGYYAINREKIATLNQLAGGVTVTLEEDFTRSDPNMKKGETIRLSDEQAVSYIHDRYEVGDETNISRMKRQKQYMQNFLTAIKEKIKETPAFADEVYRQFKKEAVTDLSGSKISHLMNQFSKGKNKGFYEIAGTGKIGKALGDGIDHAEFYLDEDSLLETLSRMYQLELAK